MIMIQPANRADAYASSFNTAAIPLWALELMSRMRSGFSGALLILIAAR